MKSSSCSAKKILLVCFFLSFNSYLEAMNRPLLVESDQPSLNGSRNTLTREDILQILEESGIEVKQKQSCARRCLVPALTVGNVAVLGVAAYALWQVNKAVKQYGPDVQDVSKEFGEGIHFIEQVGEVLRHCPAGKNDLAVQGKKAFFDFLAICNCTRPD